MTESIEEIKKRHKEDSLRLQEFELEQRNWFLKEHIGKWFYDTNYSDVIFKVLPADKSQDCRLLRATYNHYQDYDISIVHSIDLLSIGDVATGSFHYKEMVKEFEGFLTLITKEISDTK